MTAVPGIIPGGVASRQYQGCSVSTLCGETAVPGIIPGGVAPQPWLKEAAIPGMASKISLSIAGHHLLVYIRSPSFLFITLMETYSHQWPRGGELLDGL